MRFFLSLAFSLCAIQSQALTLEQYHSQVAKNDPAYEGVVLQKEGAAKAAVTYDALTDSLLFIRMSDSDDYRPTQNPNFQGSRTNNRLFSIGVQKMTSWGPTFTASQNLAHTTIFGAATTAIPNPNYYDFYSEVELKLPFWRNFFGAETRAELKVAKSDRQIKKILNDIQYQQKMAQVQMVFYNYAARVELVEIQKEILDRAKKIYQWAIAQKARGLVDPTDVFQTQAAVALRTLELENAMNELKKAARKFNDLRGFESDEVKEHPELSEIQLQSLLLDRSAKKVRKDDLIEEEQMQMQDGEFLSLKEKANPNLDLVLRTTRVGRDNEADSAQDRFSGNSKSQYYVGLNFSVPIDVPKYITMREGLRHLSRGQGLLLASKKRDDLSAWQEFVDLGEFLNKRLQLLRDLEKTQKLKSDAERVRIQRGRSTTFQVLTFEQDYISARSQRVLAELAAREYLTQIAFFE